MKAFGERFSHDSSRATQRRSVNRRRRRGRLNLLQQLESRRLLAAHPVINEFVFNHTGADINEFVEVASDPSQDLSAYSVVILDGDGGASGNVNQVLSLGVANSSGYQLAGGGMLNSVLQNGSQTVLLVTDFSGAVNDDLDTDDDGILDSTPWTAVIDDVAVFDGDLNDNLYSTSVLTAATMNDGNLFTPGGASRIPDGVDTDTAADWVRNAFSGEGNPDFPAGQTVNAGEALNTPAGQIDDFSGLPWTGDNLLLNPLTPAITAIESNGNTEVSESGLTDSINVALTTNPTSPVTVTVTPNAQLDLGNGAGVAVVLNFANRLPQSVTVAAVDDAIVESAIHAGLISITTSSSDSNYNNKSTSVTVDIADNDTAAPPAFLNELVVNHTGADIDEFVEIRTVPSAILSSLTLLNIDGDVSFDPGVGEILNVSSLGTADSSGFLVIPQTTPEIFGGANLVLVEGFVGAAGSDLDVDDDGTLDWLQAPVPPGGLTAAPWTSIRDAVSLPGSGDQSYGFVQLSPTTLNDGNPFEVGGASRVPDAVAATTSASEWVRNDFDGQGLPNYPFTSSGTSVPGTALNTPGANNSVIAGLIVAESSGSTTAEEGGAGDTLTLNLGGPTPIADVTVTITPDGELDLGAGAGVPIIETFIAPGTGPISINVNAFDDTDGEGPHSGTITFSYSSSDPNYASGTADSVVVSITDNETATPQVVISEIMYNPDSSEAGPVAEWIEIVNIGSTPVDITGWTFDDEDTSDWGPFPGATLAAGEVAVLFDSAFTSASAFRSAWGVPSAAKVLGITWGNLSNSPSSTNEILELLDGGGNQIDVVNYDDAGDWPADSGGPSIYLTDLGADNNDGTNWAESDADAVPPQDPVAVNPTGSVFVATDEGSPGLVPPLPTGVTLSIAGSNDGDEDGPIDGQFVVALSAPAATDTTVTFTVSGTASEGSDYATLSPKSVTITAGNTTAPILIDVIDDGDFEGTETVTLTLDTVTFGTATIGSADSDSISILDNETPPSFNPGDIVINEIMKNPSAVGDSSGEYFEIFNTTAAAIDINGWTISDADTDSHVINNGGPLNVPAGGYLVLGNNADFATNGGVNVAYQYSGFFLGNGDDEVILTDAAANEIDRVEYTDAAFPDEDGRSLELIPAILSNPNPETDNDLGSNWQASSTTFGAGDFGTPGAVNSAPTPEINVTGLTLTINDGDTFPSTADGSDFGPVQIGSPVTNQFVIENNGGADLDVSAIVITGTDAADFSVSNITLPAIITPGNSVTFDVTFNPTTAGVKSATVEITNTDADEGVYDFALGGSATVGLAPEIVVESSFIEIPDGDTTPQLADNTDFGSVDVAVGVSAETYFIENTGTADLTITAINFSGPAAGDFALAGTSVPLPITITPGNFESFTVSFDPSASGARNAVVEITNDDADENPYDFAITGNGVNAVAGGIVINEVDANTPGIDSAEFIELFGPGGTSLDGLAVVLYNGSDDASYDVIDLDGFSIPADGYFVIGSASVPNVDLVAFTTDGIQNGADAVALVIGDAGAFPNDTPVSSANLLDAIVYDTNDADDSGLLSGLGEVTQFDEDANGDDDNESNSRVPNGLDGSPFIAQTPTPGTSNDGSSDTTPPTVTDVKVAGSTWSAGIPPLGLFNFLGAVDPVEGLGYSLVTNPTRTLPWTNLDTIYVQFSEDIGSFDNQDFSLGGVPATLPQPLGGPVGDYESAGLIPPANVTYDAVNFRATIVLNSPFQPDKLILSLFASSIADAAANPLDGDGDLTGGDNYAINFSVLPGDETGNGAVNTDDASGVRVNTGQVAGLTPVFDVFADLNGDGAINTNDVSTVRGLTGSILPLSAPAAPPQLILAEGVAGQDDDDETAWSDLVDSVFAELV